MTDTLNGLKPDNVKQTAWLPLTVKIRSDLVYTIYFSLIVKQAILVPVVSFFTMDRHHRYTIYDILAFQKNKAINEEDNVSYICSHINRHVKCMKHLEESPIESLQVLRFSI